jgi:hypothetical protein
MPKMRGSTCGNRRSNARVPYRGGTMMRGGEETSSESESLGDNEGDKEGEIISSPRSPPPLSLPLPGDLFGQRIGVPASA